MNTIIGVDPGKNGGIAVHENGKTYCMSLPDTLGDILEFFKNLIAGQEATPTIYLEDMVKYAGNNMPSSAMATYARSFGNLEGVVMALGFRLILVRPKEWQKTLSLGTRPKTMSKTEWKNKIKSLSQRLYPECRVTLATSDALCILEHGRIVSK